MEIVWTNQALQKINTFVDYIAQDDLATAEKWALILIEKTDQLFKQPESGRIVPEYNDPNFPELIFGNYRVIYRIRKEEATIYIQTVWHVRQDPPKVECRVALTSVSPGFCRSLQEAKIFRVAVNQAFYHINSCNWQNRLNRKPLYHVNHQAVLKQQKY